MKNTFAFIQKSEIRYEFTEASDTEIHKIACKMCLNKECRKLIKCLFPPAFAANYVIGFDPDAYIHFSTFNAIFKFMDFLCINAKSISICIAAQESQCYFKF